eukprot:Em0015g1153a
MCGQATVPGSHLKAHGQCNGNINTCTQTGTNGTGVANTDYIFYVSASNTSPCGTGSTGGPTSIAFATYCQTESSLDRPIAGNINFCTGAFSSFSSDDYILTVAKHEALHALGFSSGLFPFWRDQNGAPRTPRDPTTNLPPIVNGAYQYSTTPVMPLTYNNWAVGTGTISHPVNLLVTPAVVAAAKAYFNCSTLTGVELENQGGTGTAISHWEKRLLGGITLLILIFSYSNTGRGTTCTNATNNINPPSINNLGETYGPNSVCLNQGTKGWSVASSGTTYMPSHSGAGCYQVT